MIHVILHFVIPVALALLYYKSHWKLAALLMISTMLIDLDHMLATPIYDPGRCSIGFHPLPTLPAIGVYVILFAGPLVPKPKSIAKKYKKEIRTIHLVGAGLLIHMALDWIDCIL